MADQLKKALLATTFTWEVRYDMKRTGDIMCKGKVHGTVLSGHPTQTTTFNTLRVHLMVYYLMQQKVDWQDFVAGDDMLLRLKKEDLPDIMSKMKLMFSQDANPKIYGIGYIVRSLDIHSRYFTFLSKQGEITPQGIRFGRMNNRMIMGGNVSIKINTTINRSGYNAGIIAQLQHQGGHSDQILEYCRLREVLAKGDGQAIYQVWKSEEYNSHDTSEEMNWWDSYETLLYDTKNNFINDYENTKFFYDHLPDYGISFTEKAYHEVKEQAVKQSNY